ncbi:bacterial Ig-like domain-containing protein [Schaalia vaccimaxillae]|uniref:bacterial Ig-like domain-containing protein n=1 Tax=Schaalia vaccimaxillae TaxID=183916 RepID=UPI0003B312BA|nr:bacterial Ig-like domain-containing protein [Schaalia vaccimaxillae]
MIVGALAIASAVVAPAALAQTPQVSAVYNGTFPNRGAPVYDGISRALRLSVPNKNGGTDESQYASSNFTFSFGYGMNNLSIIDVDQMADPSSMSFVVTLTNTTQEAKSILVQYELRNGREAAPVTAGTPTVDDPDFTASLFGNVLPRIEGTLQPGQSVNVTVPLAVENAEEYAQWDNVSPFSAGYTQLREQTLQVRDVNGVETVRNNLNLYSRFSSRILNSAGTDFFTTGTQYLGTVRVGGGYTTVPTHIQQLLPDMVAADFTSENVYRTMPASSQFEGVVSNFMARGDYDSALYTGGIYFLDTARIKISLSGTGWSVNNLVHPNIGDTDQISDSYAYQTYGNGVTIFQADDEGAALPTRVETQDRQYVELYQYIAGHDITINVGDPYVAEDTLDWFKTYEGTTIGLDDARATADISWVNNMKPGKYPVFYTYTPNSGESVTLTQHVTVVGSLPLPDVPAVNDPCGAGNASWIVPEDGENLTWTLGPDGHLIVSIDMGWSFENGSTYHDFGLAIDSEEMCPAEPEPDEPADPEVPAEPEEPTEPSEPVTPSDPDTPAEPEGPETPAKPNKPSTPNDSEEAPTRQQGHKKLAQTGSSAAKSLTGGVVLALLGLGMVGLRRRTKN